MNKYLCATDRNLIQRTINPEGQGKPPFSPLTLFIMDVPRLKEGLYKSEIY
jgi:hypothetical protein